MNQTANQFGLGFMVSQKNFEWSVRFTKPSDHSWASAKMVPFTGDYLAFNPKTGDVLPL